MIKVTFADNRPFFTVKFYEKTVFIPSPSGNLMNGTDVLNRLQWNSAQGFWEPVSDSSAIYYVLTRTNTYADVAAALRFTLEAGLPSYPVKGVLRTLGFAWDAVPGPVLEPFSLNVGFSNSSFREGDQSRHIWNVWPDGGDAPFAWVLSPSHTDYIDSFSLKYEYTPPEPAFLPVTPDQNDLVVQRDFVRINGVPFDAASVQVIGPRPDRGSDFPNGSITLSYTNPPAPTTTIEEII